MIVDPDASVTAGNGVFDNPLHIDVQLVCNRFVKFIFNFIFLFLSKFK